MLKKYNHKKYKARYLEKNREKINKSRSVKRQYDELYIITSKIGVLRNRIKYSKSSDPSRILMGQNTLTDLENRRLVIRKERNLGKLPSKENKND